MGLVQKIFGTHSQHELKRIYPIADKVESYREEYGKLSDEQLKGKTKEFKERLSKGETLNDLLPEAYATVREAAKRVLGMEHYSCLLYTSGKKYIAWTVDSPLISLYHQSVFNSCNYIFIFDKFFYYEVKQMGVRNVYYLPLAVNTERLDKLIGQQSKEDRQRFAADVSFVGSMYHKNSYDDIKEMCIRDRIRILLTEMSSLWVVYMPMAISM